MFETLKKLQVYGIKPGLERINNLLTALGNPQNSFNSIVVAGTNGKGSTATFLWSILRAAGIKTALYTSPHLIRLTERIRIGSNEVEPMRLEETINQVIKTAQNKNLIITYFEAITVAAFMLFASDKVSTAILEVGMGGRLDAVNVAPHNISIITDVSFDHTRFLGSTLHEIAKEKAGIISKNNTIFTYIKKDLFKSVIVPAALKAGAHNPVHIDDTKLICLEDELITETKQRIKPIMVGAHQIKNSALAYLAARKFDIDEQTCKQGIEKAFIRGRIELISTNPLFIVDVAHNVQGIKALASYILHLKQHKKNTTLFGLKNDKDIEEITKIVSLFSSEVILVSLPKQNTYYAEQLKPYFEKHNVSTTLASNMNQAMKMILKSFFNEKNNIVICGSHFIAGPALAYIKKNKPELVD